MSLVGLRIINGMQIVGNIFILDSIDLHCATSNRGEAGESEIRVPLKARIEEQERRREGRIDEKRCMDPSSAKKKPLRKQRSKPQVSVVFLLVSIKIDTYSINTEELISIFLPKVRQ